MITITPRNRLLLAIRHRAILREEQQRLISPKGRPNKWLLDLRLILTDARALDAAADLFWEIMGNEHPFQVGGMEVAAVPLVSAILMKSVALGRPINGFIIRKERKTYGAGNLIEGELTEHPIIIVDDLINSGASLEKVRVVLEALGRTMDRAFTLVDYKTPRGLDWRNRSHIKVTSPFDLTDLGLSRDSKAARAQPPILEEIWRFAPSDPNFFHKVPKSFPATDGHRVYAGSDSGVFWALDARTGAVQWTFKVHSAGHKNIWSSPAILNGRIYFGAYDGNVYCLEAVTGREVWRACGADWVGSSPALASDLGLLFIGLEYAVEGKKGSIAAFNLETGEKVWEHITKRYTHASPAYWSERRLVACGSNDDELLMFDGPSGRLVWRFQTSGGLGKASIRHAPAFVPELGLIVIACANGIIYVVDVESGEEIWAVQTDNTLYTVPLVVGARVFVGSTDKFFYVLNLQKQVVEQKIPIGSKIFGSPKLIGDGIYFGSSSGLLYKIDAQSGAIIGKYQLPDSITNAPTYSPDTGLIYASTYTNEIFALRPLKQGAAKALNSFVLDATEPLLIMKKAI